MFIGTLTPFKSKTYKALFLVAALFLISSTSSFAGPRTLKTVMSPQATSLAANSSALTELSEAQKISLVNLEGVVLVKKAASATFQPASADMALEAGDSINADKGSCEILFDDNTRVTVSAGTQIAISEALISIAKNTRSTLLKMDLGRLKAKITKVTPGSRFEILTPSAVASVRGTTLYLNSLNINGQNITDLYVDESDSGVLFTNTESGDSTFVPKFSESTSSEDGELEEAHEATEEEKSAYTEAFGDSDASGETSSDETATEEAADVLDESVEQDTLLDLLADQTQDASLDKLSEQNVSGGAVLDAVQDAAEEQGVDTAAELERLLISKEIARLRNDIDFQHADANLAQIADAQTGKTFTDVHGNRVRVDQYVFHDAGSDTARFLSLTLRTGDYQNGVSSVQFGAQFNNVINVPLKDLPWNEYLNVVTNGELQGDNIAGYNQFIVHESYNPNATQGPALFPQSFFLELTNPDAGRGGRDLIRFEESYSDPFKLLNSPQGNFWIQRREADSTLIRQFGGDTVLSQYVGINDTHSLWINGKLITLPPSNGNDNGDGTQTVSFASSFDPSKLTPVNALNYYRNLPVNNDGDPTNDEHPAYFDDEYVSTSLIGVFIPINDSGQIVDAPGFGLRGLRDVLSPNPLVNGGNYNLEMIFFYGTNNASTGLFEEEFRIDALITPELFSDLGSLNKSLKFPATLSPDNDDNPAP